MSNTTVQLPDTKHRILETAERLFAENGIEATSLRQIISEAGVNLAAIHYHFQSKQSLVEALVLRRLEGINQMREARLDVYEEGGRIPTVEEILECFLAPVFDVFDEAPDAGVQFARFMGRVTNETTDLMPTLFLTKFRPLLDRFVAALNQALPGLDQEELMWRVFFSAGAMAFTLVNGHKVAARMHPPGDLFDLRETSWRLINFLAAGFRAGQTTRALS